MDSKSQIKDEKGAPELKIKNSNITFDNVSFKYRKGIGNAIKNLNFTAEGGKVTALVGHSGAGKSTIIN